MGAFVIGSFYVIVHVITAYYLLKADEYVGEAYSVGKINISGLLIVVILLMTILGYYIINNLYKKSNKIRSKFSIRFSTNKLHSFYFMMLLLSLYLFFDASIGSAVNAGESKLSFLVGIFSVRALFPIYYVVERKKDWRFVVNVLFYCTLRLLQGWTGFLLDIAIMEVLIRLKDTKLTNSKIIVSVIAPIALLFSAGLAYSVLYPIKNYIRFDQSSIRFLPFLDGLSAIINRVSFFSQSIASIQTASITKAIYAAQSIILGEIKSIFRPLVPSFLMDKSMYSLSLCIKQSFVNYAVSGTSLNVGILSYAHNLANADFLSFLFWIILTIFLVRIFLVIFASIYCNGNNHVLYYLLLLNVYNVASIESVFSYGYLPLFLMLPFLMLFGIIRISFTRGNI
ncbi:hypothetical protein DYP60_12945 [Sphaerochaeta halotolerans]|uniref:Oligosaccharide repeat unit polymerase n=1 Tax=Sphaerochaeta halotolerans TaxID=2293840 RepID=A0A372MDE7_9SPIR|nr:oligosaccharide repeat unit polymerase [Sphaerochaeta halotolerans]RFU93817.1 hypothetical protein DYP60_12945 [Sphaerochaeta halotolerans]